MNFKSIFLISSILILGISCQQKKECCSKDKQTQITAISDESLYQLNTDWLNQDGANIKLNSLQGKIVVTAMVFTHCESACPRIVSDMQRIEKAINANPNVVFLLISMDPERDTPARFREFSQERQLGKNWVMISSNQMATDEVANVLGVKIKKLSDGGFDHSNSIFVLDPNGVVIHTQEGLEQEPKPLIDIIYKELEKF